MEKQEIKSDQKKRYPALRWLFYGLGIVFGIVIIGGLLFWRNPFFIPSVNAADTGTVWYPEEEASYVKVEDMDLQFTGFYTVNAAESISGYYYIGSIGEQSWFVEIQAETEDSGLSQAMPDLSDYSFLAQTTEGTEVFEKAAESEGLTLEEYFETYHISDRVLLAYDTSRERDILCYVIAFLMMLGCFVAGRLFSYEA
ncbi:MAG: hypothetical protein EOM34_01605 [Clostridia bacterium]|nr:hypothetical protein [Lachnospiraceae bacterium]NCB99357.1 hypothetical protein [Clostridia bacterium]NCD01540.1 hypothetical protein [Clostridia bacterium]